MSEMVERVARAICVANCDNPDEPDHAFLSDRVTGYSWMGYIPHARRAIAEMREPTEAMLIAGYDALWESMDGSIESTKDGYRAMIDASLSDEVKA